MPALSKIKALLYPQHFFWRSRAGNSKVSGRIWLEFELIQDFMPWLPVSLIMIRSILKAVSCLQHFPHYISLRKNFRYLRACNPDAVFRCGPKSNSSRILYLSLFLFWLPASLKRIRSKLKALSSPQHFC